MNIQRAAKLAYDQGKCMTRTFEGFNGTKILPTNSFDCCFLFSGRAALSPGARWNPTLEDLISEDWQVVNLSSDERRVPAEIATTGRKGDEDLKSDCKELIEATIYNAVKRLNYAIEKGPVSPQEVEALTGMIRTLSELRAGLSSL